MGFRAPAPSAIRPYARHGHTTSLEGLLIYEDDELVFDGAYRSAYTVCETAADIAAVFATDTGKEQR